MRPLYIGSARPTFITVLSKFIFCIQFSMPANNYVCENLEQGYCILGAPANFDTSFKMRLSHVQPLELLKLLLNL